MTATSSLARGVNNRLYISAWPYASLFSEVAGQILFSFVGGRWQVAGGGVQLVFSSFANRCLEQKLKKISRRMEACGGFSFFFLPRRIECKGIFSMLFLLILSSSG